MLKVRASDLTWKLLGQFMPKDIHKNYPELYKTLLYHISVAYLQGRTDEKEHVEFKVLDDLNIMWPSRPEQP